MRKLRTLRGHLSKLACFRPVRALLVLGAWLQVIGASQNSWSLMESRDLLRTAVDKQYITDAIRSELDEVAEEALREVNGLIESLQRGSSHQFYPGRSIHRDSYADTAGDSPRRSRKAAHR